MSLPSYDALPAALQFIVLSLACYRLQRIITTDTWFLSRKFREFLERRSTRGGLALEISELFHCGHCFGWWTSITVYAISAQLFSIQLPVYQAIATAAVVSGFTELFDKED